MKWPGLVLVLAMAALATPSPVRAFKPATLVVRGRPQLLRLYGDRSANTHVVVSSGDGGWMHLAPHIAEMLAAHGCFVIGFDVKGYLKSFTDGASGVGLQDEPHDYAVLTEYASRGTARSPLLLGVSEGAGLSVLAATNPSAVSGIAGVIGVGLPRETELAWRWTDSVIYITHRTPAEPTFHTADVVGRLISVPLAAIQSTHDEFVPLADVRRILDTAHTPKRLWTIDAADHGFSGNLSDLDNRLIEAISWIQEQRGQ